MKKKKYVLTNNQKKLVEKNLSVVHWGGGEQRRKWKDIIHCGESKVSYRNQTC